MVPGEDRHPPGVRVLRGPGGAGRQAAHQVAESVRDAIKIFKIKLKHHGENQLLMNYKFSLLWGEAQLCLP